jgi:predicted acetyltransferase
MNTATPLGYVFNRIRNCRQLDSAIKIDYVIRKFEKEGKVRMTRHTQLSQHFSTDARCWSAGSLVARNREARSNDRRLLCLLMLCMGLQ